MSATTDYSLERGLPANHDAERTILGSILLDNEALYRVAPLKPEDFAFDSHRRIYHRMWNLQAKGCPIDLITLGNELSRNREVEAVGGMAYLSSLTDGMPHKVNVEQYARIVRDCSLKRQVIFTANAAIAQAMDESETAADCLSVTQDKILALAAQTQAHAAVRLSGYSDEYYAKVEKMAERTDSDRPLGFKTGNSELDALTTGFRKREHAVVGAVTGEGKSNYTRQVLLANLLDGVACALFSQEMTRDAVMSRFIPQMTNGELTNRLLRDPRRMTAQQRELFKRTKPVLDSLPLWVDDASRLTISELIARTHLLVNRHGVELVAVDYLQLVQAPGEKKYDRITAVSEGLRELAKSLPISLVVISQLSRPEKKEKRRPTLYDLKESGQIENDAHLVLLLYRPEKDGHLTYDDELIIGKQREGPAGKIEVKFDERRLMFVPRKGEDSGYQPPTLF